LFQELRVAVIETADSGELRTITGLMFYNLSPDFDLAEQKRPVSSRSIAIILSATDHVPK